MPSTSRRSLLSTAAVAAAFAGVPAVAEEAPRISGPFAHANLAVYLVHGASAPGKVPLTLQEALARKQAVVHETGDVNQLAIENRGEDELFVQSGDIVKGGKQDRVLTSSLLLPPRSGKVPIAAFCVEQGRWAARGAEETRSFSAAEAAVPSRDAKLALKRPDAAGAETASRQRSVWSTVSQLQGKLSGSVGAPVAAAQSQTSLQLALENEKLRGARADYVAALKAAGEREADIVGVVVAVNGRLNSAEIYPSNGLFRKMWPKLLDAAATEAIGERGASEETSPSPEDVATFLLAAELGPRTRTRLPASIVIETRDGARALYAEATRADGAWFHRSYVAK